MPQAEPRCETVGAIAEDIRNGGGQAIAVPTDMSDSDADLRLRDRLVVAGALNAANIACAVAAWLDTRASSRPLKPSERESTALRRSDPSR